MTWLVLSLICVPALFILAYPLLFRPSNTVSRNEGGMAVYRHQLKELEADLTRGVLKETEVEAARLEIQRRMLKLSGNKADTASKDKSPLLSMAMLLVIPVLAFILYGQIGDPDLPSKPLAERDIAAEKQNLVGNNLANMVERLSEKLQEQPENVDGWVLLARTLSRMERYEEAGRTFLQATKITPEDADLYVGVGENFYFEADGIITDDAAKAFEAAGKIDPTHAGARYYLALRDAQNGQEARALQNWMALFEESDGQAPYMRILKGRITELAEKTDTDVTALLASKNLDQPIAPTLPGPSQQDMQAASDMTAEDRQEMVQNMVARLADRMKEAPEFSGLMRLGQVYGTLGKFDQSAAAYGQASDLAPKDPEPLIRQAFALTQLAGKGAPPPKEAAKLYRRALQLNENSAEALWYLGIAEAKAGNNSEALKHWRKLKALTPPDSELNANVTRAINALLQQPDN